MGWLNYKQCFGAAMIILMSLLPAFIPPLYLHLLCTAFIRIVLALGMYSMWSIGYLNAAQPAFFGIGAYTSALLMLRSGLPFWLTLPVSGIISALVGAIIGYSGLKVRGAYFLILGIAFNELVKWIFIAFKGIFGGASGLTNIPQPNTIRILGLTIDFNTSLVPFYYLALMLCLITAFVYFRIHWSRLGRVWATIRQNEELLATTGISVFWQKEINLIVCCFFAGMAGAVYGSFMTAISPEMFSFVEGIYLFLAVLLGGTGTPVGPVIGIGFMTALDQLLRRFREFEPILWGFILILGVLFMPKGLYSLPDIFIKRIRKENTRA